MGRGVNRKSGSGSGSARNELGSGRKPQKYKRAEKSNVGK